MGTTRAIYPGALETASRRKPAVRLNPFTQNYPLLITLVASIGLCASLEGLTRRTE